MNIAFDTHIQTTPGERLKYLRSILGASREYISGKHDISPATLRFWEERKTTLSEKVLNKCQELYKAEGIITSQEWINFGIGPEPQFISNLTNKSNKDSFFYNTEGFDDEDFCIIRDANNFKSSYSDAVIMLVSGSEMEPLYSPGDYVGGRFVSPETEKQFIGKDCIIILKNGSKFFRRVFKSNSETINLGCLNPTVHEPVIYDAHIEKIAPVIWLRRGYMKS